MKVAPGIGAALLWALPAWAQDAQPPKPAPDQAAQNAKESPAPATDDPAAPAAPPRDAAASAAEPTRDAAAGAAQQTRDAAAGAAQQTRDAAAGAAQQTRDTAAGAANQARDAAQGAAGTARGAAGAAANAAQGAAGTARNAAGAAADATRNAAGQAAGAARNNAGAAAGAARNAAGAATDAARGAAAAGGAARATVGGAAGAAQNFSVQDLRPADLGLWFDRSATQGLVISDVATTGAIADLGFQPGDRIVSVNGQPITRDADFMNFIFAEDIRDQRVPVIVDRGGQQQTLYIQPAAFVKEYTTVQEDPLEQVGLVLDDRYDDRALVWKVIRRSPAFYGGVRSGDVIVGINDQPVQTPADVARMVTKFAGEPLTFQVNRGQQTRQIQVEVLHQAQAAVEPPSAVVTPPRAVVTPPAAVVTPPPAVTPAPAVVPAPAPRAVAPVPDRRPLLPRRR